DEQLVRSDRLDEIRVAADQEAGDAVVRLDPRSRNEHDRQLVAESLAQGVADLVAGDPRETDVDDDKRRSGPFGGLESLLAGCRLGSRIAAACDDFAQACAIASVVVNDQNRGRGLPPPSYLPSPAGVFLPMRLRP